MTAALDTKTTTAVLDEVAAQKRKAFFRLHKLLMALLLKHLDLFYCVETRSHNATNLVLEIRLEREKTTGGYPWVTFYEHESSEVWDKKMELVRAFAKGEITMIPDGYND